MDDPDRTSALMSPAKLAELKPKPATPAAWLDQLATDAGRLHVRRLCELEGELRAQASLRDFSTLADELARLAEQLPRLDFGLLQRQGWWARTTGKRRSAGAEFESQFEEINKVASGLAPRTLELLQRQNEQALVTDRTLMEVDVEYHALDKIIDQGARWLNDMRNQLKQREAAATDAPSQRQIKDDAARCELLLARLKALRSVSSAAQQAHQQALAAATRRTGLLQLLQQAVAAAVKAWQARVSALAHAAGDSGSPVLSADAPMETHRELQLCLKQAITDCAALRAQEHALAESVTALGLHAQAAS